MAISRIRSVRPKFFQEEDFLLLPLPVRMTFLGLMMFADDFGNESCNPALLKSALWPLEESVTGESIEEHLVCLEDAGYLRLYTVGSRTYYAILDWLGWQRVDKPTESKVPKPPREPLANGSRAVRDPLAVEGRGESEGVGESERVRGEGAERGEGSTSRPAPEDLSPFCPKHPDGTTKACRACGTARLRYGHYMRGMIDQDDLAEELDPADMQ